MKIATIGAVLSTEGYRRLCSYLLHEALPVLLSDLLLALAALEGTDLVAGQVRQNPTWGTPLVYASAAAAASAAPDFRVFCAQVAVVEAVQLRRQAVVPRQQVLLTFRHHHHRCE